MVLLIRLMKNEQALRKQESNFPIEQQSGLIQAYPYFRVDNADPKTGDIWTAITEVNRVFRDIAHVGFYQGNMVELYISARGNGDGVYGIGSVQHEDGIQIKELVDPGKKTTKCGVSRELVPALNRIPAATSRLQSPACKEKS